MKSNFSTVWLFALAQALMLSCSSMVVFVGGFVGHQLAPNPKLATLPIATIVVGTALSTVPVAMLMKRLGRRLAFRAIIGLAIFLALFSAYTIAVGSFWLFCLSTGLLGLSMATTQQFRFAAMESVQPADVPKAASYVLLGGIAAAFLGPELAVLGKDLLSAGYAGSLVLLAACFSLAWLIMLAIKVPGRQAAGSTSSQGRNVFQLFKNPVFVVAVLAGMIGYGVMSFIMTATPISMHVMHGYSLTETKWVIQSHIVGMFAPSLFTAILIRRIGLDRLMWLGLIGYLMCIGIGILDQGYLHYWFALVLLGIGWNFLFVSGTSLLPGTYTPQDRYKVQAFNDFLIFGSQAIVSLSAGWFIHQLGWEILLMSTIPLLLVQAWAILNWKKSSAS